MNSECRKFIIRVIYNKINIIKLKKENKIKDTLIPTVRDDHHMQRSSSIVGNIENKLDKTLK